MPEERKVLHQRIVVNLVVTLAALLAVFFLGPLPVSRYSVVVPRASALWGDFITALPAEERGRRQFLLREA